MFMRRASGDECLGLGGRALPRLTWSDSLFPTGDWSQARPPRAVHFRTESGPDCARGHRPGLFFSRRSALLPAVPVDPEPPDLPFSSPPPLDEAIAAGVVAAHVADSRTHGHGGPVHTHCENCGAELQGVFCHRCGQHDLEFHRSFGHVFLDALENFFHFDAKFFRNIVTLLFRPGRLSADFNAGKRASQMPPFRLYLFVSVLFFFIGFLGPDSPEDEEDRTNFRVPTAAESATVRTSLAESFDRLAQESADPAFRKRMQQTATQLRDPKALAINLTDEQLRGVPKALAKKVRRHAAVEYSQGLATDISETSKQGPQKAPAWQRELQERMQHSFAHQQEIREAFIHAAPKMLLLCLPIFAFITRVLFRHTGSVYLQHLVIALHYHTFVYLWWVVSRGWVGLAELGSPAFAVWMQIAVWTWILLYPLLMLRRLFGQSWKRTCFKTALLAGAYSFTLFFGFICTAIVVFLLV